MAIEMMKLVSGEFVIADMDILGNATTPLVVQFGMDKKTGQLGVSLFPLNPFADSRNDMIPFAKEHIMFKVNPPEEVYNEYVKATSGIIIAKKNPNLEITR